MKNELKKSSNAEGRVILIKNGFRVDNQETKAFCKEGSVTCFIFCNTKWVEFKLNNPFKSFSKGFKIVKRID